MTRLILITTVLIAGIYAGLTLGATLDLGRAAQAQQLNAIMEEVR